MKLETTVDWVEERPREFGSCVMETQCGICEFEGELQDAPLFLCLNCADAIRRLVWIRERERQAAEAPLAKSRGATAGEARTAASNRP